MWVALAAAVGVAALPVWSGAQGAPGAGGGSGAHTIVVTGDGAVAATPDQAAVTLGVETVRQTAQDAQNANSAAMAQIIREVIALGIPADQMRTTGVTLTPERQPGPGNGAITGYSATNQITVTVNDLRLTGRVIDAAVGAGANQVAALSFGLRDPATQNARALRLAVQNAQTTAATLAQAAAVGPIHLIRLEVIGGTAPVARAVAMQAEAAQTPVLPGTISLTVTVRAVYGF
jgi:uncharacterized protein YggE